ncbi:Hypothetical protein CINCED_3A019553 [Cinara cedri]|uniref:Uncharacterized protein n=1 Tax=Cinara cedri TaxID=506608 RepID=A0A5E4M6D8_9HEMI|nr:Hypothetical protein CINCED_3A019553 [Cinara cedri]
MSIFKWFNKVFGIDDPKSSNDLPSEFRLPTENTNIDVRNHNFGPNDINDSFIDEMTNDFDEQLKNVMVDLGGMLGEMLRGFQIPDDDSTFEDNVNFIENRNFNQLSNKEEYYNGVPKKNFIARNYFLSPSLVEPVASETISPRLSPNVRQNNSKSYSRIFGNWNGKMIEKETTTRQLFDGITEHVTVLKDGNQKCITIVTENSRTGEKNCNKQLVNLDESQLVEFENRFSKLMW